MMYPTYIFPLHHGSPGYAELVDTSAISQEAQGVHLTTNERY